MECAKRLFGLEPQIWRVEGMSKDRGSHIMDVNLSNT